MRGGVGGGLCCDSLFICGVNPYCCFAISAVVSETVIHLH